jgi:hypothetical protein
MRASIMRDVQREQRGRSIAVKNCRDDVTMLPCFWAGAFTDSLSPMAADGWAVMAQACASDSGVGGQYRSHSKRINELGFRRAVARRAVKVDDTSGPDKLKSFGNAIHLYVPRVFIFCRDPSFAGLSAMRACEILNPTVAGHPVNIRPIPKRSYVVKAALRRDQKGPLQLRRPYFLFSACNSSYRAI